MWTDFRQYLSKEREHLIQMVTSLIIPSAPNACNSDR